MQTETETKEQDPWQKSIDSRKIILFNGPSRCGKSLGSAFVANFVRAHTNEKIETFDFAEPLKKAAHALFCAFHGWSYYDTREGESQKGMASGDFLGMSPREAYISLSEEYLKPKFGPDALGFLMKKRIARSKWSRIVIIPNCGFIPELKPLIDLVGQRNVLIIEVHAANKTFEGDSRRYVGDEAKELWPHISVMKIPNVFGDQGDRDFYKMLCEGAVKKFLKIKEEGDQ